MKTKLVSLFVALFASTALWAYDFKSEDGICYSYIYDDSGNVTVMVVPENDDRPAYSSLASSVSIPTSVIYNGTIYSVTSIGSYAFSGCTSLTSVTIPNSVTSIWDLAFDGCTGLTSITIPNSITSIGAGAFGGCTGLTSVTIPNSVTSIWNGAFYGCTGLTSVTIGNGVTSIGFGVFFGCTGLASIIIESSNTVYDSRNNCNAIIETETNTLILGSSTTVIPNSVTSIGEFAFSGCTGLTSVTIPNSVTSIGRYAFEGCTGLTSVTIPNSVTWIGSAAFKDTPWLENQSGLIYIGSVLYTYRGKMPKNTSIVVKDGVTSIGDEAFDGCTGLTSIIIPNSVTSIGDEAFDGCTGLTSITIPNSVTSIGDGAFYDCTGFTSITIPNVTIIGEHAFNGCTGLISVVIGNNIEYIISGAFGGCENLTRVTCYANVPPSASSSTFPSAPFAFDKDRLTEITLYVPASAVGDYKEANCWKYFGHIVPIRAISTDTDEPVIMPSYTEVTIAWPTTIGAKTYTITITKDAKTICSLTFDDTGVLINAAFAAPSYNGNAHQAPAAQNTQSAFWFTFNGLECNTQYDYSIVAQSSNGQPISTYDGTFRTTAPTAIDNVPSAEYSDNAATHTRKIFHNGQVLIQHNGKTYTISGNEVK